jgi:hypothetical protein
MSTMSQAETNKRLLIVVGGFVAFIFVCVIVGSITGYNAAQTKAPATVGALKADHVIDGPQGGLYHRQGSHRLRHS